MQTFVCFLLFAFCDTRHPRPDVAMLGGVRKFLCSRPVCSEEEESMFDHDLDDRRFRGKVSGIIWSFHLPNGLLSALRHESRGHE